MPDHPAPSRYAVLVPVKPPAVGKSRLAGLGDGTARRRLAEAFAQDTVLACLRAESVHQVLVVTDDAQFSYVLSALGCAAIPDGVSGDLNATLRQAAAEARRRWPDLVPVALCADLPALRPDDLDAVLGSLTADGPSFVPDAAGIGTTVYVADHDRFDPHFGPGSRAAHLDAGARELADAPSSVRRDVDDPADLADAVELGVGASTTLALLVVDDAS
ncbi:2-phospho-L-lactate guanylyltransferase [Nocardioides sp. Root1257]|uniref:2-phospho-L-lactate guanylyltransferase n=1 Tax=unclassified Nocardioides TaxID=2615069 RepID=UPI0006FFCFFD|nr:MULTISPECIES: 2-phospho-L-lactate guanylyltransferase [unclassified Nocardioides]KQW53572.1 2-phospho-L-lactate guanylyltransferase [Nocardioides sp. Root1257]KRC56258.1 2-phospho-L-lactate guanylyltransferase [Nocardioides sp. Root224]